MKDLNTLPAEEMRSMLKSISEILDTPIPVEWAIEKIGMEFFKEEQGDKYLLN